MILTEIRDYLRERGSAELQEIALHFDIAPDTAQFALHYWQQKGKVREQTMGCPSTCGSKGSCSSASATPMYYEWLGRSVPLQFVRPERYKKRMV